MQVERLSTTLGHARRELMKLEYDLEDTKVWFWRWRPEHKEQVEAKLPAVQAAREHVRQVQHQHDAAVRDAKGSLGLWSAAGVEEGRRLFWCVVMRCL